MRIITFNKGADFQALVEFASSDAANSARQGLDGKDVYEGCCHIRANFSNKNTLTVKQNDNRSWDYTLGRPASGVPVAAYGAAGFGAYSGGAEYGDPLMDQYGGETAASNPYTGPAGGRGAAAYGGSQAAYGYTGVPASSQAGQKQGYSSAAYAQQAAFAQQQPQYGAGGQQRAQSSSYSQQGRYY